MGINKENNFITGDDPVTRITVHSHPSVDIRIKRDDLYPETGGGSKARKCAYIVREAILNGYDCIVSNGGVNSNHARSLAISCALHNLKCSLVIHDSRPEQPHKLEGNLLLMEKAGAAIRFCQNAELASAMDEEIKNMEALGYRPLYLWGGGHCLWGSLAYYAAALEAIKQCGEWVPDYVVHASGTGTTQAGLIAGYAQLPTKVVGFSVARYQERGIRIIKESLMEVGGFLKKDFFGKRIDFRDDCIFGGYEKTSEALLAMIDETAKDGLILDPTYTGKAWYGLTQMIESGEIRTGDKVLFWHTGGLLNLLTSPHARDYI